MDIFIFDCCKKYNKLGQLATIPVGTGEDDDGDGD